MREYHILEGLSTNVLVVDVQPAYDGSQKIVTGVTNLLNSHIGGKYIMYNGYNWHTTDDSEEDVIDYFTEHGLNDNVVDNLHFIEKDYGFFRAWMGEVPDSTIIRTIRAMVQKRIKYSCDLDINDVFTQKEQESGDVPSQWGWKNEGIYIPDFVSVAFLKNISPFVICGGGRNECLREIELICNAFNIRYKRIDSLVY